MQTAKRGAYTCHEHELGTYYNSMTPALRPVAIELAPYLELKLLGFDIDVKTNRHGQFKLLMLRGDEIVTKAICARSANLSVAEALERMKLNRWGDKSQVTQAMRGFVELARFLNNKSVQEASHNEQETLGGNQSLRLPR